VQLKVPCRVAFGSVGPVTRVGQLVIHGAHVTRYSLLREQAQMNSASHNALSDSLEFTVSAMHCRTCESVLGDWLSPIVHFYKMHY
jgi:hypothetical protein